jgi:hypothetical protein
MATQFDEHVRSAATVDTRPPAAGATRPWTESDTDLHRAALPQTVARRAPATRGAPSHEDSVRIGLQLLLGYEWWVSGVDKLLVGNFPAMLHGLLAGLVRGGTLPGPFAALLSAWVLPHAAFFGFLVEWAETLAGLALLAAGTLGLLRPLVERRLAPSRWLALARRIIDALALGAAAGTCLMGLSFFLLDGAPTQWAMPSIAFGGALDTGLLLAIASAILLTGPASAWVRRYVRTPQRAR